MNAYKLNGNASNWFRSAICKHLGVSHFDIYKTIQDISRNGVIYLKDGRKFELTLKEIKDNE